jgi:hypothetical protein
VVALTDAAVARGTTMILRLAIFFVLVLPLSAFAKLEIRNVQPSYGPLGPARTSDDVYPLDEYGVRYQVAGIKPDKEGRADLEVGVRLTNSEGKAVYDPKPGGRRADLSLGGDTIQTFGFVTFPETAVPGEYKLAVSVRDKTSGETANFERKLTLKLGALQIVALRFSHDAAGTVPAGLTLLAGDTLHYQFKAIGFDRLQKKVSLVMRVQVLDADGKDIGAKPQEARADLSDPAKVAEARQATLGGQATMNRAGDFKLKITVEDTIAKKTTTFEAPLKVLAP